MGVYGSGANGTGGVGGSSVVTVQDGGAGSYEYGFSDAGYGGGGGVGGDNRTARDGMSGAVRIIWPGQARTFPITGTQNV